MVWTSGHGGVDDWALACREVEVAGRDVRGGIERLRGNVWIGTLKCLVCILNGHYSRMCGGTSYQQTSNPSVAWKKWMFSK